MMDSAFKRMDFGIQNDDFQDYWRQARGLAIRARMRIAIEMQR